MWTAQACYDEVDIELSNKSMRAFVTTEWSLLYLLCWQGPICVTCQAHFQCVSHVRLFSNLCQMLDSFQALFQSELFPGLTLVVRVTFHWQPGAPGQEKTGLDSSWWEDLGFRLFLYNYKNKIFLVTMGPCNEQWATISSILTIEVKVFE